MMNSENNEKKLLGQGMVVISSGVNTSQIRGGRRCICSPGGWAGGNTSGSGCACGCSGLLTPEFATTNGGANNTKANT